MSSLSEKIIVTVVYYDILDYPMTSFEIWKYLIAWGSDYERGEILEKEYSLRNIMEALESEELKKYLEEYQGFYFLCGRKVLVEERLERNKLSEEKYKIAKRVTWFLRFVPYIRMVAVTGRVAMKNAGQKSDIDFFVVLEKGKIFTGRTLVTLFIHLLGKRRYGKKIRNRICLNYFITTDQLEISHRDLFSSSEYFFITAIFGKEVFADFQKANHWIREYKPNWQADENPNSKLIDDSPLSKFIRRLGEKILEPSFFEIKLKAWQTKRIEKDPRTHLPGSLVLATDTELIFLPKPQGPKIFEKFKNKMEEIVQSG